MATDSRLATETPGDPGALRMRSFRDGDTHVVKLAGELDLAGAAAVERELLRADLSDADVVALDLRELRFIESTGIRVITEAHRRSSEGSDRFVVVRGTEAVQRTFQICDVDSRLPFVDHLPSDDGARPAPATGHVATRSGLARAPRGATSRRVSQAVLAAAVRDLSTSPRSGILR